MWNPSAVVSENIQMDHHGKSKILYSLTAEDEKSYHGTNAETKWFYKKPGHMYVYIIDKALHNKITRSAS